MHLLPLGLFGVKLISASIQTVADYMHFSLPSFLKEGRKEIKKSYETAMLYVRLTAPVFPILNFY